MKTKKPALLSALDAQIRTDTMDIAAVYKRAGFECFLVGGCVRDLLLGRKVGDLDFTTNAYPSDTARLFKRTVPTGLKHGTVTVLCGTKDDSRSYEVTTYRADGTYTDARRPDHIAFASNLSEDLKRRDFTMNALAYDPITETLVDEHGGLVDIAESRIRTIGLAHDRFFEDGLRTVRACRFAAVLGFSVEHSTLAALGAPDIHARVGKVAIERFTDELWKGMAGTRPSVLIALLDQTGLMKCFLNAAEVDGDTLSSLDRLTLPSNRMSIWVRAASRDFPGGLASFCGALKLSGKETAYAERVALLSAYTGESDVDHRRICAHIKRTCTDPAQFLRNAAELAMFRPEFESLFSRFAEILRTDPLLPADLALRGQDLLALGFEGPAIGAQIEKMLDLVYADPSQNTPELLTRFLTATGAKGP